MSCKANDRKSKIKLISDTMTGFYSVMRNLKEDYKTYIVNIRLYTTQNSFFGQKTEIMQAIYGFETKELIEPSDVLNVSKQTFFRISDSHIFDY